MNGNYLIPANTKKGQLLLGLFKLPDLIMFGIGVGISLILLILLPMEKLVFALIAIAPALITGLLVLPVAYYYNVKQLIIEVYEYFTKRNRYLWKGWCILNESEDESDTK